MMPTDERDQDLAVIAEMQRTGGGFVKALGTAAGKADPENLRRIKAAFPEIWETYQRRALAREPR
jgi:phage gp37-like protein